MFDSRCKGDNYSIAAAFGKKEEHGTQFHTFSTCCARSSRHTCLFTSDDLQKLKQVQCQIGLPSDSHSVPSGHSNTE